MKNDDWKPLCFLGLPIFWGYVGLPGSYPWTSSSTCLAEFNFTHFPPTKSSQRPLMRSKIHPLSYNKYSPENRPKPQKNSSLPTNFRCELLVEESVYLRSFLNRVGLFGGIWYMFFLGANIAWCGNSWNFQSEADIFGTVVLVLHWWAMPLKLVSFFSAWNLLKSLPSLVSAPETDN